MRHSVLEFFKLVEELLLERRMQISNTRIRGEEATADVLYTAWEGNETLSLKIKAGRKARDLTPNVEHYPYNIFVPGLSRSIEFFNRDPDLNPLSIGQVLDDLPLVLGTRLSWRLESLFCSVGGFEAMLFMDLDESHFQPKQGFIHLDWGQEHGQALSIIFEPDVWETLDLQLAFNELMLKPHGRGVRPYSVYRTAQNRVVFVVVGLDRPVVCNIFKHLEIQADVSYIELGKEILLV